MQSKFDTGLACKHMTANIKELTNFSMGQVYRMTLDRRE